jgi:ABC-type branched-subunit amino acid transport system permease subunit
VGSIVLGPLLGSVLYTVFDEYLVYVPGARSLIMGALLLVVIFFLPEGLISVRRKFRDKFSRGSRGNLSREHGE